MVEKYGRHEETRTPDLYRVNFKVSHLKSFSSLAFPIFQDRKYLPKSPSFGDELVTSSLEVVVDEREP
jgi:hypothetical protein